MTDADRTLDAFFADDGLPVRDQAFTDAVMRKAALRRLWTDLVWLAGVCLLAALVLWGLAPTLEPLLRLPAILIETAGPVVGALVVAITLLVVTAPGRSEPVSA